MRKYIFQKFFFSFTQPRLISNKRVEKFANKFSSLFPRFLTRNLWSPQVVELVKYKKERKWNESEGNRTKAKRVPTVKKELSTQKEILIGSSNETTRVSSKSLSPSEVPVNRLNEQLEPIRRRNVVVESSNEVRENDSPSSPDQETIFRSSSSFEGETFIYPSPFSIGQVFKKLNIERGTFRILFVLAMKFLRKK